MKHAWLLLALVVAPVLPRVAAAQAAGEVTFDNGRTFTNYINATECGGGTIKVSWTVNNTVPGASATYTVYASNQSSVSNANNACFTDPNSTTGREAASVGSFTGTGQTLTGQVIETQRLVTAAGKDCSAGGDQIIYVCVQGVSNGTTFGFANGQVILNTSKPPPPKDVRVTSGDRSLHVSWDPGDLTSAAPSDSQEYRIHATFLRATTDVIDAGTHTSSLTSDTDDVRIGGLVNTVVYGVTVTAFSKAGTEGDPSSPAVEGMPEPALDFWDAYKAANGQEQGGCASGSAGFASLAAVAALLAARRRK